MTFSIKAGQWFAKGLAEVHAAFAARVRPLLWKVRSKLNLPDPADPVRGFVQSGYAQAKAEERGTGGGAGLGA